MIWIIQELCTDCGICSDVCPRHIPVTTKNGSQISTRLSLERTDMCMECGHCVALCPHHAIEVESLDRDEFIPVESLDFDDAQLLLLLKQRRSIRNYRDKPVPRQIIDRIIEAARCAPTGTGRPATGMIVIDDPNTLAKLSEFIYELYESLEQGLRHPIGRVIVRRKVTRYAGQKNLSALQDFVMPGMHWYIRWYREGRSNEILRDCPALMLFHNPISELFHVNSSLPLTKIRLSVSNYLVCSMPPSFRSPVWIVAISALFRMASRSVHRSLRHLVREHPVCPSLAHMLYQRESA